MVSRENKTKLTAICKYQMKEERKQYHETALNELLEIYVPVFLHKSR